jgi:hypothetical protein
VGLSFLTRSVFSSAIEIPVSLFDGLLARQSADFPADADLFQGRSAIESFS